VSGCGTDPDDRRERGGQDDTASDSIAHVDILMNGRAGAR